MEYIKNEKNNDISQNTFMDANHKKIEKLKKCICEIYKSDNKLGIGFLAKIPYESNLLPLLITSNTIITKDDIDNNEKTTIILNDTKEEKYIELKEFRKMYIDKKEGITCIEIKQNFDKIKNLLEIDDKINKQKFYNNYYNKNICVFNYNKNNSEFISYGSLINIQNNYIEHSCDGSPWSPIILLDNFKLIGINCENNDNINININKGIFIKYLIDELNNNEEKKNIYECEICYKIEENKKQIKIFGNEFIKNNKDNCKIIINGYEEKIKEYIDINDQLTKTDILKIKLILIKPIKDMSYMFKETSLLSILNISQWDVQNVTNMSYMFYECLFLKVLPDISIWNTKNVKDMSYMFFQCKSLIALPDISHWDTKNVTNISYIFFECTSFVTLPLISKWNTENITDMSGIFYKCISLKSLPDISKWKTDNVTNVSYIFSECTSLKILPDISEWNTEKIKDMSYMFSNCSELLSLPNNIDEWDIKNVNILSYMFEGCKNLLEIPKISNWNTKNVNDMSYLFNNCEKIKELPDISEWNTGNVTNMNHMFYNCSSLSSLPDISKWDTKQVNDMNFMFGGCSSLSSLPDISKWDIKVNVDINYMFFKCKIDIPKKFKKLLKKKSHK